MIRKNKAEVCIYGSNYTVVGTECEEYLHKVSTYIDKKMKDIAQSKSTLSTSMVAVLAAINIADDYFKNTAEAEKAKQELQKYSGEIQRLRDECLCKEKELGKEVENTKAGAEEKEALAVEIERLKERHRHKENELGRDRERLESECCERTEQVRAAERLKQEAEKKGEMLEKQLCDLQSRYRQMEEQLERGGESIRQEYENQAGELELERGLRAELELRQQELEHELRDVRLGYDELEARLTEENGRLKRQEEDRLEGISAQERLAKESEEKQEALLKELEHLKSEYSQMEELLFEECGRLKSEHQRREEELLKRLEALA